MENISANSFLSDIKNGCPQLKRFLNYARIVERVEQQDEIVKLVHRFNWSLPQEVQDDAVKKFLDLAEEEDYALLPIIGEKRTWENATHAIKSAGYPKNKQALPGLMFLFQDINWPGALESVAILKDIDRRVVMPFIAAAIKDAFDSKDYQWLWGIRCFLNDAQICKSEFEEEDVYDLLAHADLY